MSEPKDVYIGHSDGWQHSAQLNIGLTCEQRPDIGWAAESGQMAEHLIGRVLHPNLVFVMSGSRDRLYSAMAVVDVRKPPAKQAYDREQLSGYLATTYTPDSKLVTDHIVITTDELVDTVSQEIRALSHNPVDLQHF